LDVLTLLAHTGGHFFQHLFAVGAVVEGFHIVVHGTLTRRRSFVPDHDDALFYSLLLGGLVFGYTIGDVADRVDALGDQVLDDRHLGGRVNLRWPLHKGFYAIVVTEFRHTLLQAQEPVEGDGLHD
jgi:hypothetical protein